MSRSVFSGEKPTPLCIHCGLMEHEHCHRYEPRSRPEGCVCDPEDGWSGEVPPVCGNFKGDPEEYCETCEHEFKCHKKP